MLAKCFRIHAAPFLSESDSTGASAIPVGSVPESDGAATSCPRAGVESAATPRAGMKCRPGPPPPLHAQEEGRAGTWARGFILPGKTRFDGVCRGAGSEFCF